MILRYPAYYDNFTCIADRCEDTCCAGWEIDIDDKSYEYYMSVEGEFGERLRASIKDYELDDEDVYEAHGFRLKDKKRCPFLNDKNLCDMYIALGEDALCDVCTNTPRNFLEYGGARELAISASCAEAGRLIYGSDSPITFVEKEIEDKLEIDETEEEVQEAECIRMARDFAIAIVQNREYPLSIRIRAYLDFSEQIQECLNENEPQKISEVCASFSMEQEDSERTDEAVIFDFFLRRMVSFSNMECINEEWQNFLTLLTTEFVEPEDGCENYKKAFDLWEKAIKKENREYEYEHLLVYYIFMCQSRCVDDYDFLGKTKLVMASFLMIRDMDIVWCLTHEGAFTQADRVMTARVYAKEVEHSEENLEYLADEFLFEDAFNTNNLVGIFIE